MKHLGYIILCFVILCNVQLVNAQDDVKIGTQVWTSKNLDVSTFRNGDPIPQAKNAEEWKKAGENRQPAWCYYNNNEQNGKVYGKLYNWHAVNDSRGLAPNGYHIPSDAEWTILTDKLGGEEIAGKKMKSKQGWGYNYSGGYTNDIPCTNCKNWSRESLEGRKSCPNCLDWGREYRDKVPCHTCKDSRYLSYPKAQCKICRNTRYTQVMVPKDSVSKGGDNSIGFNGLSGGYCDVNGYFNNMSEDGNWWSSSESNTSFAWYRSLNVRFTEVFRSLGNKEFSFSVRCLKD